MDSWWHEPEQGLCREQRRRGRGPLLKPNERDGREDDRCTQDKRPRQWRPHRSEKPDRRRR